MSLRMQAVLCTGLKEVVSHSLGHLNIWCPDGDNLGRGRRYALLEDVCHGLQPFLVSSCHSVLMAQDEGALVPATTPSLHQH